MEINKEFLIGKWIGQTEESGCRTDEITHEYGYFCDICEFSFLFKKDNTVAISNKDKNIKEVFNYEVIKNEPNEYNPLPVYGISFTNNKNYSDFKAQVESYDGIYKCNKMSFSWIEDKDKCIGWDLTSVDGESRSDFDLFKKTNKNVCPRKKTEADKYLFEYQENKFKNINDLKTIKKYEEIIELNRYFVDEDIEPLIDKAMDKLNKKKVAIWKERYKEFDLLNDKDKLECLLVLNKDKKAKVLERKIIKKMNENSDIDYRLKVAYYLAHEDEAKKASDIKEVKFDNDTLENIHEWYHYDYGWVEDYFPIEYNVPYFTRTIEVDGQMINLKWTLDDVYLGYDLVYALNKELNK